MENITISKDMTVTKAKLVAKENISNLVKDFLTEKFGGENVKTVRVGSTPKNLIGVRIGTVEEEGFTYDLCVTIDISAKDFKDRVTSKKTFEAFDFDFSAKEYENYLSEKAEKESEKKRLKEEKIAKDKKAKEKE